MEQKRILNLNAPLLSVRRRHNASPDKEEENVTMKSVRDPGVVPFRWETAPGRPNATTWHCQQQHSPPPPLPPRPLPPPPSPANIGGTMFKGCAPLLPCLAFKASSFRILNPAAAADENILEVVFKEKLSTKTYSKAYSQSLNGVSPCQNDAYLSGFVDERKNVRVQSVCDNEIGRYDSFEHSSKNSDSYKKVTVQLGNNTNSASYGSHMSEKSLSDTPTWKSSIENAKILVDAGDNCNEMSAEGLRSERDLIEEVYVPNKAPDIPELVTSNLATTEEERSPSNPTIKTELEDEPTQDISCNDHPEEATRLLEEGGKNNGNPQFLLPLALPKSPTESWLWRALPSVSEKNQSFRASLGVGFNSKNKCVRTHSSAVSKSETTRTTSEVPSRKMRLSEILAMPTSED